MWAGGGERREDMVPGTVGWLVIWGLKSRGSFLLVEAKRVGGAMCIRAEGWVGVIRGRWGKLF